MVGRTGLDEAISHDITNSKDSTKLEEMTKTLNGQGDAGVT